MDANQRRELLAEVRQARNCSHPIRISGEFIELSTGEVLRRGLTVACKDRRRVLCPACSDLYQMDAFIIVASGLYGGKGTSNSVTDHPRIFATLTAPSFGPVHRINNAGSCHQRPRQLRCPHGLILRCTQRHQPVDGVQQLREAMPDRLKIMVDMAVWCQMRRGEIFGLQRSDIDLENRTVNIERSRTYLTTGESLTKSPKTAAGRRKLIIPQRVMPNLAWHLSEFTQCHQEALLVTGLKGEPITAMSFQRAWNKSRATINREDLHFHDLRHTGLTLAAATGATTAELMRRAGHASPDAALRYQHATLERDNLLASKLDAI